MGSYIKNYFLVNLKDYPNINIDLPINAVIFAAAVGMCIAILALHFRSAAHHSLIKQLLRHEALGEDNAKTLAEIGLSENASVRKALLSLGRLRGVVVQRGGTEYTYDEYVKLQRERALPHSEIDFETAAFFIPRERRGDAERILEKSTSSLPRVIFTCIFIVAVFVCISAALPSLLDIINASLDK